MSNKSEPWNWIDLASGRTRAERDASSLHRSRANHAERRPRGRPPLREETSAVTVMLTQRQIEVIDQWIIRFNTVVQGSGGHRVKRNHVIAAFIEAIEGAGYDAAGQQSLRALQADLRRRLSSPPK